MPHIDVSIKTRDGLCQALLFTPAEGTGPWPAVIYYMDAFGMRPVLYPMAQRLADLGYVVLLPDLFYRRAPYVAMNPSEVFSDPKLFEELLKWVGSLDRDRKVSDTEAFLDFLPTRPEVKGTKFGATGYCMGGNIALTVAGAFPDRFSAAASFHGGNLATDKEDSPHHFIGQFKGRVYVAGAIEDGSFPDEQKTRLEAALSEAGVPHVVETYAGARHGFAVPDLPVFNVDAAERHWTALKELFGETL